MRNHIKRSMIFIGGNLIPEFILNTQKSSYFRICIFLRDTLRGLQKLYSPMEDKLSHERSKNIGM